MAIPDYERVGNLGYLSLAPETAPGVAATPIESTLLYDETMTTNRNLMDQAPIYGQPFETFQTIPGQRTHQGDLTVVAEPNTLAYFMDMLYTSGSTTGSGPYNWPFTLTAAPTKSYTMDVSTGNLVKRYCGVMASKITPNWNKNEMQLKVSVSALYSFLGAPLAGAPTGSGPYTVELSTEYTDTPTLGLVVGDLIRFYHHGGSSYTDATLASIVDDTHITTSTNVSTFAEGDYMYLRPATPSFDTLQTFLWSKTNFQFGDNLTDAASADPVRCETGSTWELDHYFEKDGGSDRSGSEDPASLVRTTGLVGLTIKKFFDLTDDLELYKSMANTACIVTHYAGPNNEYKFQISYPQLVTDDPLPQLKAKSVNYETIKMHPNYNSDSSGGFSIVVTNSLASLT